MLLQQQAKLQHGCRALNEEHSSKRHRPLCALKRTTSRIVFALCGLPRQYSRFSVHNQVARRQRAHFARCRLLRAGGCCGLCLVMARALWGGKAGAARWAAARSLARAAKRAEEAWGAGGGSDAGDTLYYLGLAGKWRSCAAAAISCRPPPPPPPPLQPCLPPPPLPPRPQRPLRPKQWHYRAACRVPAPDGGCHVTNSWSAAARRWVVATL
jgi:hypothetical protein